MLADDPTDPVVHANLLPVTLHVGARAFQVGHVSSVADEWRDELTSLLREAAQALDDVDLTES